MALLVNRTMSGDGGGLAEWLIVRPTWTAWTLLPSRCGIAGTGKSNASSSCSSGGPPPRSVAAGVHLGYIAGFSSQAQRQANAAQTGLRPSGASGGLVGLPSMLEIMGPTLKTS